MCASEWAISTFSPVNSQSSNGMRMCVCVRNELEVCTTLTYPHISSFCAMSVVYASTCAHVLKSFEDSKLTGLKVDTASECVCVCVACMQYVCVYCVCEVCVCACMHVCVLRLVSADKIWHFF